MRKNMRLYKYICTLFFLALSIQIANAQEDNTLDIEGAISKTLENNFDISLSKNNVKSTNIDAVMANAGYLPTVSANASYEYSSSNTNLSFNDPNQPEINANGAVTENINAGIMVNYNIYSGGRRKHTFGKLKNTAYLSELQLKQQMEQSVFTAVTQYLNALRLKESVRISATSVEISRSRYERASSNYAFGAMSKLELLNAEVDLRNDSTNYVQAQLDYKKSLRDLNNAMGLPPDSTYALSSDFTFDTDLLADSLLLKALEQNTAYLLARNQVRSAELDEKIASSDYLPSLDLSGGYTYSDASYDANFIRSQSSLGWNAGVTLSYNIFDAGTRKRAREKAEIQIVNQRVAVNQTINTLKTDLLKAYDDYQSSLSLITLLEENVETAILNYERSAEAFSTGQITGIELREAQLNLLNAQFNVSAQRIQAKLAEVNLHFYSGTLVE